MKNSEYWRKRLERAEGAVLDTSEKGIAEIGRIYDNAIQDLDAKIRAWYQRLAANNNISIPEARKLLSANELKEFHWTINEYIKRGRENGVTQSWMKELENASAKTHISRLESMMYQLREHMEEIGAKRLSVTEEAVGNAYSDSYYRTAHEIAKGAETTLNLHRIDGDKLKKVLAEPWTTDGRTFSDRIWADKNGLVDTARKEITRMLATGAAPDKAIDNISKAMSTSKSNAGRVVMTESAYFASAGQKDCFTELGVEKFEIVASLDHTTCGVCGGMDGKVLDMKDFAAGITAPPFHPWCRCCTAPYYEDMEDVGKRTARNIKDGKTVQIPQDISYGKWKAQLDKKYGAGTIDKMRDLRYTETADKKQFEKYKKRLGSEAPRTLEVFRKIKHEKPETYEELKGFYAYKGRVREAKWADYSVYKAVKNTRIYGSVIVPPVRITNWSDLTIDSAHILKRKHDVSLEEAQYFIRKARFCLLRTTQKGEMFINFYSSMGTAYLRADDNLIRTAYKRKEFDEITMKAVVEAENAANRRLDLSID